MPASSVNSCFCLFLGVSKKQVSTRLGFQDDFLFFCVVLMMDSFFKGVAVEGESSPGFLRDCENIPWPPFSGFWGLGENETGKSAIAFDVKFHFF